jgi:hypothetical protein
MIFLIQYDRRTASLIDMKTFADHERAQASRARLELEIALQRSKTTHDVVLLEAANEADLRATHRRYFEDLEEIVSD